MLTDTPTTPLSHPNQGEVGGASLPPVYRVSLPALPWCQTGGSAGPSPGTPRSRWPPREPAGSSRRRGRRCCGRRPPGSSGWGTCGATSHNKTTLTVLLRVDYGCQVGRQTPRCGSHGIDCLILNGLYYTTRCEGLASTNHLKNLPFPVF